MNDSWSSTESDWQGVNTNITPENHNLVESENIFDSQMFANSLAGLLSNGFYPLIDYSLRYTDSVYVGIRYTPEFGDCCFVAVANNSTKITVSGKTPFSYSYFSAIDINVDKWMTRNWNGNIPSGAKLCVINFRKEDNVETPGFDTLVVTQDNNVVFDNKLQLSLDTINNEALERETSINTEVIEELSRPLVLSDVTRVTGWIGTNQVYNQGNHITLDVTNITKIKITATQEKKCVYLLLTEKYNKDGEGWTFAGYPSFLCNGETSRREIAAGQTQIISIPSDCKYILIGISSNDIDIDNYIPSEVIIGEGEGRVIQELEEIQEELNRNVDNELSIDVSELTQLPGWIAIGGWKNYNNNGSHVTIDITGYSNVKLTANSDRDTFFFFAKDDFVEPIGNTSYMTYLCEGETGRRSVTKGETSIFNIPSDCKYICIGCISSATYDYSPVSTILTLAKGLKQRTTELENEVTKIGDDITNINTRITRKIKILSIGNSFSQDSFSYVPMLLESIVPDIDITLGILYKGSCSLQMHWENRESSNYYTFGIYKTSIGSWSIENSKGLDYGLEYTDWDIITLQQNSANSDNYSTYQPYLNNLIGYIADKCSNYKLGWLLTHSWADGYSSYNSGSAHGGDSNGMSALIKAAAKKVMDETTVDILFPYGSAIQNARQNTVLNALGNGGQMCGGNEAIGANANKVHLNEGMPCQVAAYTNVLVILDVISAYKGINGNDIRVDASFVTTYNIPGPHGTAEGSTDANCIIGQRAASLAVKFPWVLQSSDVMNDD